MPLPLLWRATLRHFLRHRWQTLLAILGISLGVAAAVAVDLAGRGAEQAFRLNLHSLTGRATHRLTGPPAGIPDTLYLTLRRQAGELPMAPLLEALATLPQEEESQGRAYTLLGLDPLAEGGFRDPMGHMPQKGAGESMLTPLLTRSGALLMTPESARELGLEPGEAITLMVGGRPFAFFLAGLLEPADPLLREGLAGTLIADLATVQEATRRTNLSAIDLILPAGEAEAAQIARVQALLPPGLRLAPTGEREEAWQRLTAAFRLNLFALSLLALLVGGFIIHNAMTFSVVERRPLIALIRTQGVTRRGILRAILGDALLLGIPATLLGLILGLLLGHALLDVVARTIHDHYFRLHVTTFHPDPLALLQGGLLGVAVTLLAALPPAWEAASTPLPEALRRSSLEGRSRRLSRPLLGAAGLLLALAALLVQLPGEAVLPGFAALFALLLGAACAAPAFTLLLVTLLRPPLARLGGPLVGMAVGGVARHLSRHGVAVAALAVALSATIGMGGMIHSFRGTVAHWLEQTLSSDLYVTAAGQDLHSTPLLDPAILPRLRQVAGIASVGFGRRMLLENSHPPLELLALEIPEYRFQRMLFKEGKAEEIWPRFQTQEAVIVSEPLARHRHLALGSALELPTPTGAHAFTVAGIYYDYGSEAGAAILSRSTFLKHWNDPGLTTMGIQLAPDADPKEVTRALRQAAGPDHPLRIRPNRELRRLSLEIFDRTFAITGVMRLLALLVAFLGMLTALAAIQMERGHEFAVCRALGLSRRQLAGVVAGETLLAALSAVLLALPLGWLQGMLLMEVISRRTFGWTIHPHWQATPFVEAGLLALLAAGVAAAVSAWRLARAPLAEGLRGE